MGRYYFLKLSFPLCTHTHTHTPLCACVYWVVMSNMIFPEVSVLKKSENTVVDYHTALPSLRGLFFYSPVNSFPLITHLLCATLWTSCADAVHISFTANSSSIPSLHFLLHYFHFPEQSTLSFIAGAFAKLHSSLCSLFELKSPSPVLKDWLSFLKLFFKEGSKFLDTWSIERRRPCHLPLSLGVLVTGSVNRVGCRWLLKLKVITVHVIFTLFARNIHFWSPEMPCKKSKYPRSPSRRGHMRMPQWTVSGGPSLLAIFTKVSGMWLGCLVPTRTAHPSNA